MDDRKDPETKTPDPFYLLALGDGTGTIQTQYTYEPFGYASQTGSANTNSYKYTGREDDGSGLYYYRARYYHPRLQRFIAEDPIGFEGGDVNIYGYVRNHPLNLVDPEGESPDLQDLGNALVGFGDSFYIPILIRDLMDIQGGVDKCSGYYKWGKTAGFIWGAIPIGFQSTAWIGGTRVGHWLNHGQYWRIGPGRMPSKGAGLPAGTNVPRAVIGPDHPGVKTLVDDWRHFDLRSRLPFLPPVGGPGCDCQ